MPQKNKLLYWFVPLLLGICFDVLFWEKTPGVSTLIFVLLVLAGLFILLKASGKPFNWHSLYCIIPLLFFSVCTIFRSEPYTQTANYLLIFSLFTILMMYFLRTNWLAADFADHFKAFFAFYINLFAGGANFLNQKPAPSETVPEGAETTQTDAWRITKAVLRGLLLAAPITLCLCLLLGAADQIFAYYLIESFLSKILADLPTLILRAFIILIIAYFLLGAIIHALMNGKDGSKLEEEQNAPNKKAFFIESMILLVTINALFIAFIIVQVRYLFANPELSGIAFNYSEYARRGFFELIIVVIISMVIFYLLDFFNQHSPKKQRTMVAILGMVLLADVGVMLYSAYYRILLYEAQTGFTRLRTVAHLFIFWLALLLVVFAVLSITRKFSKLPLVLFFFFIGYGATLNLVNVDAFIVRQNMARALRQEKSWVVSQFLTRLSIDSVPPLFEYFNSDQTPAWLQDEIGVTLTCHNSLMNIENYHPVFSYHVAMEAAKAYQTEGEFNIEGFHLRKDSKDEWVVLYYTETGMLLKKPCYVEGFD